MRSRKIRFTLLLIAGLGPISLAASCWVGAPDWRSLDARIAEARSCTRSRRAHFYRLVVEGAPGDELEQASVEMKQAEQGEAELVSQRTFSWHARLRREVRRRTGW